MRRRKGLPIHGWINLDKPVGPTSTQAGHGALVAAAGAARRQFGTWHLISLLLNFVTVLLVTVAMALAARLPERSTAPVSAKTLPLSQIAACSGVPASDITQREGTWARRAPG